MRMLWTGEYDANWYEKFSKFMEVKRAGLGVTGNIADKLSEDALAENLQGVDVLLIGYDPLTSAVLHKCPDLKLVLSVRDGPEENIDIAACEKLGIPVISSAGRCTVSVAEYTFLMMLLMARPVIRMNNIMRKDGWTLENKKMLRDISETSSELFEKTLGIIGMGRNGRHLAKLAQGFGMRVIGYDPYANAAELKKSGIELMELGELMASSDYISILARLTPDSEGLVSREMIAKMKPTACLINTARAKLLDTDAALDALEAGKIRMCALDVFSPEPVGRENRIYQIPEEKLLITPHGAGFTKERVHHQCKALYEQYVQFVNGEHPAGCVTRNVYTSEDFRLRGGALVRA